MASSTNGGDTPKSDPKSPVTREEHRALLNHWMGKLRLAKQEVETAREPLTAAQEAYTALMHEARADLGKGYTRKRLAALLEDVTSRLRNLLKEENDRFQDRVDLGLPVYGTQADLFGAPGASPQEAQDEIHWEADGYLFGRRGAERDPPEGCPPRFAPAFLKGYDRGQDETGRLMVEAMEAKKRLAEPAADQKPVDLNPEPEPTLADEQAQERKAVSRAKASLAAMGAAVNEVAA